MKAIGFRFVDDDPYTTGVNVADFDKYKSYRSVYGPVDELKATRAHILDGVLLALRKEAFTQMDQDLTNPFEAHMVDEIFAKID